MGSTSVFGHGLPVEGALLQMDNGASPDAFVTIANVSSSDERWRRLALAHHHAKGHGCDAVQYLLAARGPDAEQ